MEEPIFKACYDPDAWEKYFTIKSLGITQYETNYKVDTKYEFVLKMRVSILNYSKCYAWELITDNKIICQNHPFSRIKKDKINLYSDENYIYIGGINAQNKVMDSLFELIMMTDDELGKNSGHVDNCYYRAHLIKILHSLWD